MRTGVGLPVAIAREDAMLGRERAARGEELGFCAGVASVPDKSAAF